METASVFDYRELARKRLPRQLFEFIDGGAFEEQTLAANHEDYSHILLHKRLLRDVSTIETHVQVLGQQLDFPLILAPVGFAGAYARRGEVQAAAAAKRKGIPFCLSTLSICSVEEVCQVAPCWFQLYMLKDRGYCRELLQRAHAAGCPVLLFTVDLPLVGIRWRDIHHAMAAGVSPQTISSRMRTLWQYLTHPRWLLDVVVRGRPLVLANFIKAVPDLKDLSAFRQWVDSRMDASLTWKDLEWVRAQWPGKLVLKGVMDPEDGRQAAALGAGGIVVSNHAGRHLDSTPSTISLLPGIVDRVGDQLEILVDGGIFSGLDIIKALACGARAVLVGRAWTYALAARGETGVGEILDIYRKEMAVAMAHLGVRNVSDIDRNLII
ncbi:MAG: L-lactate dehydrogenase [Parachlamydia sp.]|nr:L-lactate dehydrogenase [Parachlamydia sp.]